MRVPFQLLEKLRYLLLGRVEEDVGLDAVVRVGEELYPDECVFYDSRAWIEVYAGTRAGRRLDAVYGYAEYGFVVEKAHAQKAFQVLDGLVERSDG